MGEFFQDSAVTAAILEWLIHHSRVLQITGNSYRMKDYKLKREQRSKKNTGRFSLIDRWKKTVPRCFSAEAGEIKHRLPLKNDIF